MPSVLTPILDGFFIQASLILALGAQNIFVLESGLNRSHHLLVASLSSLCDLFLIFLGVMVTSVVIESSPLLKLGAGTACIGFLTWYGTFKIWNVFSKKGEVKTRIESTRSVSAAILLTLGFSLLNPHVYLDTILLLGGYASKYESVDSRLMFALGASVFSAIWFFSLSTLSARTNWVLQKPCVVHWITGLSGALLLGLALKLALDIYS